ncbi:class I SAM-dependent methyltransferase [Thalassotalea eurytherma]|uniref:SAM-dependent methyltransferase n=1 Tax=Thalassotalea eurytherma TaxID=1144278 RepID=A0ABQ6GYU4_9GAMM|nr:class I SAM-dependent methyltransferase [Thalassotalea eurytherma]GLX81103.1 SAM-dependent methyltransferase [Thalassotalea eurytherma]
MMKPALSYQPPIRPYTWQELPNGESILFEINKTLAPWWQRFFGYHLLKIGALSGDISTKGSSIKHQMTLSPLKESAQVVGDVDELPFIKHSVDVCVLAHALEFSDDPHHVVREASRVLIPNGYLVITGYNAMSLAGLNCFIPFRRKNSPWNGRFFSPMRVKDWLHLKGFEILSDDRIMHVSLANELSTGVIAKKWQQVAQYLFPSLGSIYIIVAKKREWPLTPIKPKVRIRPSFSPVKVSTMNPPQCKK